MKQCRVIGIEWPNWEPLNYILFSVYREDIKKLEEEIWKLKEERDKWRGKYNRLKSEFNLLKNKIWTTKK